MLTRLVFGSAGTMANSDHLVGALVVTFSIIAWAEVARAVRFVNVVFGAWLIAAPWLLSGGNWMATTADMIAGALLILLAIPRGRIRHHYGGCDKYLIW